jgi:hypothetical protein
VDDFYEEDEPVEKIVAAFERGRNGVTGRPTVRKIEVTGLVLTTDSIGPATRARSRMLASMPVGPAQAGSVAR